MRPQYDPAWVESTAQAKWLEDDVFRAVEDETRPKFYACSMLPYPSGKLHMGHVRNYTINDMLARHMRMKGFNVLMPMGWDAFGLPAENAAMQSGVSPAEWTRLNIADMKAQMQPLGLAFDWSREIATCDPQYYKWSQWFFLKLLEKGVAYKKTQVVNWDPVDQTVLANEQVIDGRGWRSGALVEQREIPGYYLRITQYAEELLSAIDTLEGWPDRVRIMQRNWIGKASGDSGACDGLTVPQAIVAALAERGMGEEATTWRLRDWGISRQRYWGTPIPIIRCEHCGDVPVPYSDLPVVLPTDCIPDGSANPLLAHAGFRQVACPRCAAPALRETDTLDTFVDSSWYFMRYCDPDSDTAMVGPGSRYWMPVDQYIGGIEHAVLHLLYARFWTRAMRDEGLVAFSEPFMNLFTQGMLLRESYYRKADDGSRRWFYPAQVTVEYDEKSRPVRATALEDGLPVIIGGVEKMSKSKNNVVEPKDIISRFGADTARLFTIFAGPPDQDTIWSDSGVEGAYRFLRRLWTFAYEGRAREGDRVEDVGESRRVRFEMHRLLQQVNSDYERMQYNTVVSGAMKMLKVLEGGRAASLQVAREGMAILLQVLNPVTPHITQTLWAELGFPGGIYDSSWPAPDNEALKQDEVKMMVQVNGKLRGEILIQADVDHDAIRIRTLADPVLRSYLEGASRMIVVPNRLVNFVI
ncbi:leucine--tRNA ligase [Pseudomonas sp. Irchel 3H3]|uniref:leucine--tRNA ligase n=1 Tax=Pseudomonas sp. Irchel 3H3 TaxID=2009038 RepID=UPI000BA4B0A1|nr:class I tRNA ligase family protein [Pseudomonas sp. Irchel 3H3]